MDEILEIIEEDARTTPEKIAEMTGRKVEEVRKKIAQYEKDKVILKYTAIMNKEKTDEVVQALIEVKVAPEREKGYDAIAERIIRFPEVKTVYLLSGTYDLLVVVEGRNLKEVATFVSEKLAPQEQVQGTVTHFLLKKYKEQGVVFHEKEGGRRLAVSP